MNASSTPIERCVPADCLVHGVTTLAGHDPNWRHVSQGLVVARARFHQAYVFPDSEILSLGTTVRAAEAAGFETRDTESLREHYAMTLRYWVRRLEPNREEVVRLVGDATYRVWRLYMCGSAHAFANARINLKQVLLAKPDMAWCSQIPLTRRDLYEA